MSKEIMAKEEEIRMAMGSASLGDRTTIALSGVLDLYFRVAELERHRDADPDAKTEASPGAPPSVDFAGVYRRLCDLRSKVADMSCHLMKTRETHENLSRELESVIDAVVDTATNAGASLEESDAGATTKETPIVNFSGML